MFVQGYELEVKIKYLKEEDLAEVKEGLGIQRMEQRINLNEAQEILDKFDALHLSGEISKNGSGSEFYNEFNSTQGNANIDEFLRWVFTESRGGMLIEKFENMFNKVELLEHYSTSFKFKVSRDNFSIGYLFGMMEDIKGEFSISEYSVSQTSLEQIFNNFAKEAEKGVSLAFIIFTHCVILSYRMLVREPQLLEDQRRTKCSCSRKQLKGNLLGSDSKLRECKLKHLTKQSDRTLKQLDMLDPIRTYLKLEQRHKLIIPINLILRKKIK